jgi:hypothetical protein
VSTATERIERLRASEWRELLARGRDGGRNLARSSMAQVRRHPLAALGLAALLGLVAFTLLRRSASRRQDEKLTPVGAAQDPALPVAARGLLSQTLGNAARAWIVHRMTQPAAAPKS